jgi:hypothetical protein
MEKINFCRLCGGYNIFDLGKINGFTLSKCKDCSLVFIRETLNDEYLARFYTLTSEQEAEQKTRSVYYQKQKTQGRFQLQRRLA